MPLPYDAILKTLLDYPRDWLKRLNIRVDGPIEEVTVDLSTVTAGADRVFRIAEAEPWILHLEFQSSWDSSLVPRLLKYNGLLYERHGLPIHSVVILLRREAGGSALTGSLRYQARPELGGLALDYGIVRVWEWPAELLLAGGVGTLPLTPLSADVTETTLPSIIQRMERKIEQEVDVAEARRLWTATYVLLGLRYPRELGEQLLRGVAAMKDSVTYQAIIEEGEAIGEIKGVRRVVLRLGGKNFGAPTEAMRAELDSIIDLSRLERMTDVVLNVSSWRELLDTP